eukprot:5431787-Prymnesium_polylepis.1
MGVKATHAVQRDRLELWTRGDERQRAGLARRVTQHCCRSSSTNAPKPPGEAGQRTIPDPPDLPNGPLDEP